MSVKSRKPAANPKLWEALVQRRTRAGPDVYAVRTTGIYCRFGCASRTPRPENVEFFADLTSAERAGYRACKRCVPTDTTEPSWVSRACRMLEAVPPPTTQSLAAALHRSPSFVSRIFKRELGVTPQQYARRVRSDRVGSALETADTVTEAVFASGHAASSRFYETTTRDLGMHPRQALQGGAGTNLTFVVTRSTLGLLLVGWTERGVCHVALGSDPEALRSEFRKRFREAQIEECSEHVWASLVVQIADGTPASGDLPLDVRGTAFQERVWALLRNIPPGETRTYGDIARALDSPSGARAVARACATNRIALLIPCHRVVGANGALRGYRWGTSRKAALLQREAQSED